MDAGTPSSHNTLTHRETMIVVLGVLLPVFMGSLDNTILASALPTIGREYNDVHNLPWLVTAYLIANTSITALYGKISDIRGRTFHADDRDLALHGGLDRLRARAQHVRADPRARAARPWRRRIDLDRHGGAGRRRRTQGPRQVLRLFLHHLHHRRRLRPGARRRDRRVSALVGDLLDEHPARPDRAGADADVAAPSAPPRPAAQTRLHSARRWSWRPAPRSCWRSAWAA